jgi:hypothetical protein
MTEFKKTASALAVAGFLAAVAPGAAQADVMASSVLETTNFTISGTKADSTVGTLDFLTDFTQLSFTTTGTYSGTYTGYPAIGPPTSGTSGASIDSSGTVSGALASVDLSKACTGPDCGTWNTAYGIENSFTHLTAPPPGNYTAVDQQESGSPLSNTPGSPVTPAPTGALAKNGAYVGLTTDSAVGDAQSTNNVNSNFIFQLAQPTGAGALTFNFDIEVFLYAQVTGDEVFPGFATASYQNELTLTNLSTGLDVFSASPDLVSIGTGGAQSGKSISLNAPLGTTIAQTKASGLLAFSIPVTVALNNTDLYQLSVRSQVNADARRESVPEPATLALLGIGMAGLGFGTRRRG